MTAVAAALAVSLSLRRHAAGLNTLLTIGMYSLMSLKEGKGT